MIGLTAGLEIARKALSTYQLAISIYGNNIANVNTPGFSRRRPLLEEGETAVLSFGRVGLGVDIKAIGRMRDRFLDSGYWQENGSYGKYEALDRNLAQIEMAFLEPSDSGLGTVLSDFWDGWQELANQPESITSRTLVAGRASSLCDALNHLSGRLDTMRESLNLEVEGIVDEINSLAGKIAFLNGKIVEAEASGSEAGDLRDQRDLLLDDLSNLAEVRTSESADGSVSVKIGTEALVERTDTVSLGTVKRGDGGIRVTDITLGAGARVIHVTGGKLAGLLECRDRVIPRYMSQLDEIAKTIVERVNEVHRAGYGLDGSTGRNFFDPAGLTASTIRVSQSILDDGTLIAASSDGTSGSNANALAIADIRLEGLFGAEGATCEEFYSSLIGDLGIEASRATDEKNGQELLLTEINTRRESVKGVSIDEEMTNLVASQHAYQAAVKLVSVIDELMNTLMTTL
jgi:flagellar hook-associated protein 1 FlgK